MSFSITSATHSKGLMIFPGGTALAILLAMRHDEEDVLALPREKSTKRLCAKCSNHPAGFHHHGRFKTDADHDLCPRCWKSMSEQERHRGPLSQIVDRKVG